MNLARYAITPSKPTHIIDARFDQDANVFTTCTPAGFAVYRTLPMTLVRKRELSGGTLSIVQPLHASSLLFLVGGGRSPLYPANKVIFWDESKARAIVELEFRERVRGLSARRGWLAVALRRRVVLFEIAFGKDSFQVPPNECVRRHAEWDTCDNPRGLVVLASKEGSTLLAMPGRQTGHVQLVHLPPCMPTQPIGPPPDVPPVPLAPTSPSRKKNPASIIPAHETALTVLACPPSGRLLATTSARGTLVRVWDVQSGAFVREFRRGTDKADIFGVAFRPDEKELCVWSDKGTVHVFALSSSSSGPSSSSSGSSEKGNRQSTFSPLTNILPLPKYFGSEWSYAQYRIPTQTAHISLSQQTSHTRLGRDKNEDKHEEERCTVAWVRVRVGEEQEKEEWQLLALTWTGGWYRLGIPGVSPPAGDSSTVANAIPTFGVGAPTSPTRSTFSVVPGSPPSPKVPLGSLTKHRQRTSSEFSMPLSKGKGKEKERRGSSSSVKKEGSSRDCVLHEYRKFGRWDGWG